MQRNSFELELVNSKMITQSVLHLEFIRQDGQPFDYIPGQFITFHFQHDGKQLQRSYSVATIPTESNKVEIAVSPFKGGPGTELLFNLKIGESLETTGPFGRLVLRDEDPQRYILIATGTGVTPYRAMLPELKKRIQKQNIEVMILLGVQTPEDLLYGDDFLKHANNCENLEFHAFYSRKMPTEPNQHEHKGYVQSAFDWIKPDANKDVVYLCGNPNMIDDAFTKLRELDFATKSVRREKYISPKR